MGQRMRVLLHTNSLNERGTTVAVLDYAEILKNLGHEPIIAFCENDPSNNGQVIARSRDRYELNAYQDFRSLASQYSYKCDLAYFIKYGNNDGKLIPGVRNIVHAVFQAYQPHGDDYYYVSKWLAKRMRVKNLRKLGRFSPLGLDSIRRNKFKYLPHVVHLPETSQNMREEWNIPANALVGGRHGGFDTFDIPWVHETVKDLLSEKENLYFVFANTRKFMEHPRVKYLPTLTSREDTSSFLSSLDFFLHARARGETFGLSLLEAMKCRVPVFSHSGGIDRNHTYILRKSKSSLFETPSQLKSLVKKVDKYQDVERNFSIATEFSQKNVQNVWTNLIDNQ